MKVDLGIWDKLTKVIAFLLIASILVAVAGAYAPLLRQNQRMREEILRLKEQVSLEEARSRQLKTAVDALRNDPKTVERLARERLGYARPGETVIRFQEAATNRPPPAP
ncbi:MAG: septum formation initiator family protein [Verrucomicrobia bacterium]|nr:septum formation initiator family protein [Verrucomicrobiota bacterium]